MHDLDSVEKIDQEIRRLEQLRSQVIVTEAARVKQAMKDEAERFKAVAVNHFTAYAWSDAEKKSTSGGYEAIEVITENDHFFVVIEVENDGSVTTFNFPGPVSFGERYSRNSK